MSAMKIPRSVWRVLRNRGPSRVLRLVWFRAVLGLIYWRARLISLDTRRDPSKQVLLDFMAHVNSMDTPSVLEPGSRNISRRDGFGPGCRHVGFDINAGHVRRRGGRRTSPIGVLPLRRVRRDLFRLGARTSRGAIEGRDRSESRPEDRRGRLHGHASNLSAIRAVVGLLTLLTIQIRGPVQREGGLRGHRLG